LGEIFDVIGEYGRLEIRSGRSRQLEREYVEGMYWERGLASREMITDQVQGRTEFEDASILISDIDINEPQQLFPALELALRNNLRSLLIVAGMLSEKAIGFLLKNKKPDRFQVIAVPTPGHGKEEQRWALEDLSLLTGGRPFIQVAGDTFRSIKLEDFGRARRVWADRYNFGFVGGKGDARALRQHIATLRKMYQDTVDPVLHENLLKRIGKLLGGSATLWVGGETKLEIEERVERAKRTAAVMRGAMMEGVLPGGGVALLACRPVLQRLRAEASDPDEKAAYRILVRALAEPFRTIVGNAGFDASDVLAEVRQAGPGCGFDVTSERVVDVAKAGIWDAATVEKTVVYTALTSAAMALTVDVMIHRREQPQHASIHTPSPLKKL
jgi:chaperonin GroEL